MRTLLARLGARDRRALRLGALIVLPVLAWTVAIRPYLVALDAARERVRTERALLARERALLAEVPGFPERQARAARADSLTRTRLFTADDIYGASATLGDAVGASFARHDVTLRQSEATAPVTRPDGLVELGVAVQGEGDFASLLTLLRTLESNRRLLQLRRVAIEREPSGLGGPDALTVSATVRAFAAAPSGGGR